jgi:transcriptional regulator with XRE-family HTH domain
LSQRTLADRIGVDAQTVKRLEGGVGSFATLVAAMTALNFRATGVGRGASLSEQLRDCRSKRAWSLDQLAAKAGLSKTTVASLERGGGSIASLVKVLAVLAPNARRQAPERSYWGQGDKTNRDSRFTPPDFMDGVYAAFGAVDLDPCADLRSPVIAGRRILLSEGGDGLAEDWSGELAYVNPPFSNMLAWLRRAHEQWRAGNVTTVVCLVPVRTDSAFFHDTLITEADIFLLQGRVKFLSPEGKSQHTPFSLMVVTLGATAEQRRRYAELVPGHWLAHIVTAADRPARSPSPANQQRTDGPVPAAHDR